MADLGKVVARDGKVDVRDAPSSLRWSLKALTTFSTQSPGTTPVVASFIEARVFGVVAGKTRSQPVSP
jgi:hypothetical protein